MPEQEITMQKTNEQAEIVANHIELRHQYAIAIRNNDHEQAAYYMKQLVWLRQQFKAAAAA
jgi:hypothetical protein